MYKLFLKLWQKRPLRGSKTGPKIPSLELDVKDDFGLALQQLNAGLGAHEQELARQLLRYLIRVGQVRRPGAWQEREWSQLRKMGSTAILRRLVDSWMRVLCHPRIRLMSATCCRSKRRRKEPHCYAISHSNARLAKGILWACLELEKERGVPQVLLFASFCNREVYPIGLAAPQLAADALKLVLQRDYWPIMLTSVQQYPTLHRGQAGVIVRRLLEQMVFRA